MVQAVMSRLGSMLTDIAKEEVEKLLSVPGEIAKLQRTLLDLSSIIADAERRRIRESAVERWLKELRDAMYETDDILDEYKIMKAEENASSSMHMTKRLKTSAACFSIQRNMGRRIHALNQRLEDIEVRSSRFGFVSHAISSISTYGCQQIKSSRRTAPGIDPSDGVERILKKIRE
ncbi:hypothetical protein QOZ80_3BG0266150 [Eleusine coracana subsp. coracana]|nr:hypothetical protein QOZ80_3BG0266150 [Eleusine coracana subsp. coracana]